MDPTRPVFLTTSSEEFRCDDFSFFVFVGLALGAIGVGTISLLPHRAPDDTPARRFATEQEWIRADIVGAIAGMMATEMPTVTSIRTSEHIWSPATYAPLVERMLAARRPARKPSSSDRAWVRALRLRITGDWRSRESADTLLEKLRARAGHSHAVGCRSLSDQSRHARPG